ncbi:hypothetical protein ACTGW9_11215, partial [Streptococcus suis]
LIQTQAIASFPFYCFCFVIDDLSLDKSPCTFGSSSLIFKGLVCRSRDNYLSLSFLQLIVNTFLKLFLISFLSHIVKSSATSSLITRDPEVKLSGLAQTEISRIDIEEVVWGAH